MQMHKPVGRSLLCKTLSISAAKKIDSEKPKLDRNDLSLLYPLRGLLDLSPENVKKKIDGSLVIRPVRLKQYPYTYRIGYTSYIVQDELQAGEYHPAISAEVGGSLLLKNDMEKDVRDFTLMIHSRARQLLWLQITNKRIGKPSDLK
jgi:hypothetical protein